MRELNKAEATLLLTILRLEDNAYGVAIKRCIQKTTGKTLPYGKLYFILEQLTRKGYVKRFTGDSKPERGGRSRIYYTLTSEGSKALKHAYKMQQIIWNGYEELTWGERTAK